VRVSLGSPAVTRADWPADSDKERKRSRRSAASRSRRRLGGADNPYAGKPKLLDKLLGKNKATAEDGDCRRA
jgi:hypothetical protein